MIAEGVKKPASPQAIAAQGQRKYSEADRALLAGYGPVADLIAANFGSGCEVVVHSLEDLAHSVVKIVNGKVSGRSLGSPVTELGLQILSRSADFPNDVVGPYFCRAKSGKPLKSTTLIIRNAAKTIVGFLCINFALDLPLAQLVEELSPSAKDLKSVGGFEADLGDLVAKAVAEELETAGRVTGVSPTEKNRRMTSNLEKRGIFEIKGSVDLVAGELGLTKHTIYKYLRELRKS